MEALRGVREYYIFFFQAEDGIRDLTVTGVQTCALPIWIASILRWHHGWLTVASPLYALSSVTTRQRPCSWRCSARKARLRRSRAGERAEIGRASCRERV